MLTVAAFELRNRLRLISTWVYFAVFAGAGALWIALTGGYFQDAHIVMGGRVVINSPFGLATMFAVLGIMGVSVMAAIMGRAVQQDFEHRTHSLLFSTPLTRSAYLGGRFAGAAATTAIVFSSIGLGAWLATHLPGLDVQRLGTNRLASYLLPYLFILLPNILIVGGIFFTLAALTRRMLPVYVGSVLVLLAWLVSLNLMRDVDNRTLAALLDPFGMRALSVLTRYWSVAERDSRPIPLADVLLWNRLLWCGVAAVIAIGGARRFAFREPSEMRGARRAAPAEAMQRAPASIMRIVPRGGRYGALVLFLAWRYFREMISNVYFGVLLLAGLGTMAATSSTVGAIYGTNTWPLTFMMLDLANGVFAIFALAIITLYAGELVWRERDDRVDQIVDATPVPSAVLLIAKLLALLVVPLVLQLFLLAGAVALQMAHGYWHLELGLYAHSFLGITLLDYWAIVALALAVQSVVNHKYVGHLIMVLYYIFINFCAAMGLEDVLYRYGESMLMPYSDMNGFGHSLVRTRVLQGYWGAAATLLLVLAYLAWVRGTAPGWRARLAAARERATPLVICVAALAGGAFLTLGGYVFYNTHVRNRYITERDRQEWHARYEQRYKALAADIQPKLTAVQVNAELHPRTQDVRMRATLQFENKSTLPLETMMLEVGPGDGLSIDQLSSLTVHQFQLDVAASEIENNAQFRVWRYRFAQPLAPGGRFTLRVDMELSTPGFTNSSMNDLVVANGSFVHGANLLPRTGYQRELELSAEDDRRKFGLPPWQHWPARDDPAGLAQNALSGPGADWISYDATVTTDTGQTAIAPGYLTDQHSDGQRTTFHYRMDVPILDLYAFQSARYALQRSTWTDSTQSRSVPIEIYYHPGHTFDLEAMDRSVRDSLDYYSKNFGPYQFHSFRIVEFPRYRTFAESMPNTIPYSEALGFIARYQPNDPKDVDYPYYVTAHEVAHQWWGHQVIGAAVQGTTMITETLAQYSALMVMKNHFGALRMRRFLAYELDGYLVGRSIAKRPELPLARVEDEPYIHYNKGALAMYALQDYLGEDKVDAVLHEFRERHAFKGPPYATTLELVQMFRDAAPPEMRYIVDDLFDRVVIYDNRVRSATARALPEGRYEVTITGSVDKFEVDGDGREQALPLADLIDVGVLNERGEAIAVRRERISPGTHTYTLIVNQRPVRAGIDPLDKLVNRRARENTVAVELS